MHLHIDTYNFAQKYTNIHTGTHRQADLYTLSIAALYTSMYRQTDRQTNRHIHGEVGRHADRPTIHIHIDTHRLVENHATMHTNTHTQTNLDTLNTAALHANTQRYVNMYTYTQIYDMYRNIHQYVRKRSVNKHTHRHI